MPSGKQLRATKPETETDAAAPASVEDDVTVDEPAEPVAAVEEAAPSGEPETPETPEADQAPADEAPAKKTRGRGILRRRGKNRPVEAAAAEAAQEETDAPVEEGVSDGSGRVAAAAADDESGESAEAETPAEEIVLVPHRPAGKRLKIAAAAAAVMFVAGGAFLGAAAQPVIANNALVETKLNIARTAANAITTLWSYTPENMDSLGERSARYLTGDFASQYKKFIDSIVATNKQAQVTNTTSVLGTAVESVTPTDASAVVYTNSVATSPVSKNIPSLRYLSYRLEMKRDHTEWRITRMTTITTLDLTPQL